MMRKLFTIFGALALVTLFATQQGLAEASATEITLRGRLQKTVEPGGWLIVVDGQKYLLLNAQRFQKESWFKEAAEVEATGETKSDVMTTYMEGTPFEVRSMRPLAQGPAGGNQAVSGGDTKAAHASDRVGRLDCPGAAGYRDCHGLSGDAGQTGD